MDVETEFITSKTNAMYKSIMYFNADPGPGKSGGSNGNDSQGPVTNRDNDITNKDDQDDIGEGAGNNDTGGKNEPEIDHPAPQPSTTEEKIPNMTDKQNRPM